VTALNPRQQRTVDRLLDAGEVELREAGLDAVTVRTVAARAGVSSATAYTYLASKDHLFALMFLRHLQASAPEITGDRPVTRVQSLTRALAADLASSPELAAAATRALLGTDPAVGNNSCVALLLMAAPILELLWRLRVAMIQTKTSILVDGDWEYGTDRGRGGERGRTDLEPVKVLIEEGK